MGCMGPEGRKDGGIVSELLFEGQELVYNHYLGKERAGERE